MSRSLTFNTIDLSTYGLTVVSHNIPIEHHAWATQLLDKSIAGESFRTPKPISLGVSVIGTSLANLKSNLDSIRAVLNEKTSANLILDIQSDRYWVARFQSFTGNYQSPIMFSGELTFICYDPIAYSVDLTSHNHNIDADPKTVTETTGGTAYIKPTYTLTAGEDLTDVTIKVECIDAGEELQWTGSLANGEKLEINTTTWLVRKEGVASMATVTGQFPRLLPAVGNQIKVTGFSTTGALNLLYRNTYV